MGYRIFNVRTWSFVYVHIYTQQGLGTPTASQQNHLDWKTKFFLCSWRDLNPRHLDLQSNTLTTEPARDPPEMYYNNNDDDYDEYSKRFFSGGVLSALAQ